MADDGESTRADLGTYKGVPLYAVYTLSCESGTMPDLTGRTATLTLWPGTPDTPPGGTPSLVLSGGQAVLDPVGGTVTVAVPAATLAGLAAGNYWYELLLLNAGVVEYRPNWGYVTHRPTGVSP